MNFVSDLLNQMAAYDIKPPNVDVTTTTGFHRFKSLGFCKTNCCYYAVFSQELGAIFGCWRRDIAVKWFAKDQSTLSYQEKVEINLQVNRYKEQQAQRKIVAIKRANEIWRTANHPNELHPYLIKKRIVSYYARQIGDDLIVPLCGKDGSLKSIQKIPASGDKQFLYGTSVKGHCLILGESITNPIRLCEGWATGCSIYEAIGEAVVVCFTASNILDIARWIRSIYPHHEIQICADDDRRLDKNTGLINAIKTATEIHAIVIYPNFTHVSGATINHSDFNDLHVLAGIEELENQLIKGSLNYVKEYTYVA